MQAWWLAVQSQTGTPTKLHGISLPSPYYKATTINPLSKPPTANSIVIGRQKAESIQKAKITAMVHESKGINIIKERLELLQQKTGKPASLEIKDMYTNNEATGTKVIITIPYYNPEESW